MGKGYPDPQHVGAGVSRVAIANSPRERRVFYVAMTRAKSELVVLGGRCPFVPEFEEDPDKNLGYYLRQFAYWRGRRKLKKEGETK